MKKITFPYKVKRGSVTVRIYRTPSHGCDSFTLSYYQDGSRKRPTFPTFELAKAEADAVVGRLASTDADVLTLTSADRAAYLRLRQILDPLGVPMEVAAAQFADAWSRLGGVPFSRVVDFYLQRCPTEIAPHPVKNVVAELLAAKEADGLSDRYLQCLRWGLGKFAGAFQGNIGVVTGTDMDTWLRGLELSPRTRNNLRNAVQTLFGYAKARKYLSKDHDELEGVARAKDNGGEIEIFTPHELTEIFKAAEGRVIPFLALGAFAGIRHAEIQRLHWGDIQFEAGIVEVGAKKAKTASRRTVPLLDNLRAWLLPYRQPEGLVCIHRDMASEIGRLVRAVNGARKKAKVKEPFVWKHNALRHSFISYRVAETQDVAKVSLEAGNSPQMIFKHYRELVRPAEAKAWFGIGPK